MHNTNVTVADQNTVINSNVALFDSQYLNAISTFAQIMAQGTPQFLNTCRAIRPTAWL
jgi:hypothetical protein